MRKILEAASRAIESYCNRRFYCTTGTKYFDGSLSLWIPDLLSITTLKTDDVGDGTYENVFEGTWVALTAYVVGDFIKPTTENLHSYKCTVAGTTGATEPTWGVTNGGKTTDGTVTWECSPTNYLLYGGGIEDTLNTFPKTRIDINPNGSYSSFANGVKKGVQIVGTWGYGDGTSTTPYVTTAITGAVTTTTGLTLTLSADGIIEIGHTILCESEQMYVTALGTLSATVERGVNGSTAAIHTANILSYYRYPRDIMQACIDLSVALYQNRAKQGLQSERLGDYSYTVMGTSLGKGAIESILDDNIRSYKRMRF